MSDPVSLPSQQSRFGFAKWLKPYTIDVCKRIKDHMQHNETCVLIIPIAFTQDHLETKFEMVRQGLDTCN